MSRFIVLLPLLTGCVSEEGIQNRWDTWVAEHATCEVVEDCAVVYPSCPLGCYEAVSEEFAEEADALAERLVRRYEAAGRGCDYDCIEPPTLTCDAGTCGFAQ